MAYPSTYEELLQLAKGCGRGVTKLFALAPANDPFRADHPTSRRQGEWFAQVWQETGSGPGTHLRRLHYRLISGVAPLPRLNGKPYENTEECWIELSQVSKAARYLNLVPASHVIDRRNSPPKLFLQHPEPLGYRILPAGLPMVAGDLPKPLVIVDPPPTVVQRYHLEIICEKSTVDDILVPLAAHYGLNLTSSTGEVSITQCNDLVRRAQRSDRPVRILYLSDFDPAGLSMPVAAARKIEFFLQRYAPELDVTLQPIALTHAQCIEFQLPRTPIKESERRAAAFEHRFGEGATELDALEALHPGALRRTVEDEVERFHDATLGERVEQAVRAEQRELRRIADKAVAKDSKTWAAIATEWQAI